MFLLLWMCVCSGLSGPDAAVLNQESKMNLEEVRKDSGVWGVHSLGYFHTCSRWACFPVAHAHTLATQSLCHSRTPNDNPMTREQHTTARQFCSHSITVSLITCKLISCCPQVGFTISGPMFPTLFDFLNFPIINLKI